MTTVSSALELLSQAEMRSIGRNQTGVTGKQKWKIREHTSESVLAEDREYTLPFFNLYGIVGTGKTISPITRLQKSTSAL